MIILINNFGKVPISYMWICGNNDVACGRKYSFIKNNKIARFALDLDAVYFPRGPETLLISKMTYLLLSIVKPYIYCLMLLKIQ